MIEPAFKSLYKPCPGDRVRWEYALPSNIAMQQGIVVRLYKGMAVVEWEGCGVREMIRIERLTKI